MKKGMTPGLLVGLVMLGVLSFIFGYYVFPAIYEVMTESGERAACSLKFLLSHIGEKEKIKGCKMKNIFVTPEMLSERTSIALEEYNANRDKLGRLATTFNPQNPRAMEAWVLNDLLAREMADCFERSGGRALLEAKYPTTSTTCVLCARVVLTNETMEMFRDTPFNFNRPAGLFINTYFDDWMKNNFYMKMTYKDYLKQALDPSFLNDPEYKDVVEAVTNYQPNVMRPVAVLLVHVPLGFLFFGKDIDYLQVYPYDDISKPGFITYFHKSWFPILGGWTKSDIRCEETIGII